MHVPSSTSSTITTTSNSSATTASSQVSQSRVNSRMADSDEAKVNIAYRWWKDHLLPSNWIMFTPPAKYCCNVGFIPVQYKIEIERYHENIEHSDTITRKSPLVKFMLTHGTRLEHFALGWLELHELILKHGELALDQEGDGHEIILDYNGPPLGESIARAAGAPTEIRINSGERSSNGKPKRVSDPCIKNQNLRVSKRKRKPVWQENERPASMEDTDQETGASLEDSDEEIHFSLADSESDADTQNESDEESHSSMEDSDDGKPASLPPPSTVKRKVPLTSAALASLPSVLEPYVARYLVSLINRAAKKSTTKEILIPKTVAASKQKGNSVCDASITSASGKESVCSATNPNRNHLVTDDDYKQNMAYRWWVDHLQPSNWIKFCPHPKYCADVGFIPVQYKDQINSQISNGISNNGTPKKHTAKTYVKHVLEHGQRMRHYAMGWLELYDLIRKYGTLGKDEVGVRPGLENHPIILDYSGPKLRLPGEPAPLKRSLPPPVSPPAKKARHNQKHEIDKRRTKQKSIEETEAKVGKKSEEKVERRIEQKTGKNLEKKVESRTEQKTGKNFEKNIEGRMTGKNIEKNIEKMSEQKTRKVEIDKRRTGQKRVEETENKVEKKSEEKVERKIGQKTGKNLVKNIERRTEQKTGKNLESEIERKTEPTAGKNLEKKIEKMIEPKTGGIKIEKKRTVNEIEKIAEKMREQMNKNTTNLPVESGGPPGTIKNRKRIGSSAISQFEGIQFLREQQQPPPSAKSEMRGQMNKSTTNLPVESGGPPGTIKNRKRLGSSAISQFEGIQFPREQQQGPPSAKNEMRGQMNKSTTNLPVESRGPPGTIKNRQRIGSSAISQFERIQLLREQQQGPPSAKNERPQDSAAHYDTIQTVSTPYVDHLLSLRQL